MYTTRGVPTVRTSLPDILQFIFEWDGGLTHRKFYLTHKDINTKCRIEIVYVRLYIQKIVRGIQMSRELFSVFKGGCIYGHIECVIHSMKLSYINFKFLDVCFLKSIFETEMDFSIQLFSIPFWCVNFLYTRYVGWYTCVYPLWSNIYVNQSKST